ncbi:hypothetical protein ACWDZ6_17720 [Streptomyces sp. NPDC002926]
MLLALSGAVASPASAAANALTVDVECDNGGYRAACSAFISGSTLPVTRQAGRLRAAASRWRISGTVNSIGSWLRAGWWGCGDTAAQTPM